MNYLISRVCWFNTSKGYGFVELQDGRTAFLEESVVTIAPKPNDLLEVEVTPAEYSYAFIKRGDLVVTHVSLCKEGKQ